MTLDAIPEYFLAKNVQAWGGHVALVPGETWESLAETLEARHGQHIWHPSHWHCADEMPVEDFHGTP